MWLLVICQLITISKSVVVNGLPQPCGTPSFEFGTVLNSLVPSFEFSSQMKRYIILITTIYDSDADAIAAAFINQGGGTMPPSVMRKRKVRSCRPRVWRSIRHDRLKLPEASGTYDVTSSGYGLPYGR